MNDLNQHLRECERVEDTHETDREISHSRRQELYDLADYQERYTEDDVPTVDPYEDDEASDSSVEAGTTLPSLLVFGN